MAERMGPFELAAPQPQWGAAWFAARPALGVEDDDLPRAVLLRTAPTGEGLAVALEGAWRARHPHPALPTLLRRGDAAGRSWLAFAPLVALPLETLLDDEPTPVEIALAWTGALVGAMAHHARHPPPNAAASEPLRPSFADLLVTRDGALVVTTVPAAGRVQRPGLLRQAVRDRLLLAPELVAGGRFDVERVDAYVAGALLQTLLGRLLEDGELPSRVELLVRRATAAADERFESLDELAAELARCAAEHPPVERDDVAALVRRRAPQELARAEESLR